MGKVLKADGSSGTDAWAEIDLGSDQAEIWVTCEVAFTADALAMWISDGQSSKFTQTWNAAHDNTIDWLQFFSGQWSNFEGFGPTPAPAADVWQLCEQRHVAGGAVELYVDGDLVTSNTTGNTDEARFVQAGNVDAITNPDDIVYLKNFKVGTTRGGSDLFADDFSSGDLSAWTSTSGDVSVVDDPFQSLEGVVIALTVPSLDPAPVWTRLDDPDGYNVAQTWSIHRGKASGFDKTGTGIATITFADTDGILDPTNMTGPFVDGGTATQLDPMRQVAIALQNPVTGVWWPLFTGFLSSQNHDMDMWSDIRGVDHVTWECADAFDLLAAQVLTPGEFGNTPSVGEFSDVYYDGTPANYTDEADVFRHVDDRIALILQDAQWPLELMELNSGNCSVQGRVYDRVDQVLSAIFDAADAESVALANIFANKFGVIRFMGRFPQFFPTIPGYGINTWKVGGMPEALADPTVAPISGLQFRRSKEDIINSCIAMPQQPQNVEFTTAEVTGQLVEDAASIARFGYRGESFTDLQVSAGHTNATPTNMLEEAKKQAEFIVGNFSEPSTTVSIIQFRSRSPEDVTGPALWQILTEVEINDRVQLTTQHVGGGGFSGEYYFVQGIRYEARGMTDQYHDVTMELEVTPAPIYNPFGTVDGSASP